MPPLLIGALRFAIALVVLLPFLRPPIPRSKNLLIIAVCCGPLHFSLLYLAFWLAHDLSPLAVSLQLWIPITALLSWLLLKEPPSRGVLVALLVAFLGVAVMALDPNVLRDLPALAHQPACARVSSAGRSGRSRRGGAPAVHPLKMPGPRPPCCGAGRWAWARWFFSSARAGAR